MLLIYFKTLKSLNELYEESRKLGDPLQCSPFEAEICGYFILCTLDNGNGLDILKFVKGLPKSILDSSQVLFARKVFAARHTNNYIGFFKLLKEATYLQACLMHRYFPGVRSNALECMNVAFTRQSFPLQELCDLLCFEDVDHAYSVCDQHGLDVNEENGMVYVHFGGNFESGERFHCLIYFF